MLSSNGKRPNIQATLGGRVSVANRRLLLVRACAVLRVGRDMHLLVFTCFVANLREKLGSGRRNPGISDRESRLPSACE